MLAKFNLYCNIVVIMILLVNGGHRLWQLRENIKNEAAIAEKLRKDKADEKEYNTAIAKQNKDFRLPLTIRLSASNICGVEPLYS